MLNDLKNQFIVYWNESINGIINNFQLVRITQN
jgi:hypothetical protein